MLKTKVGEKKDLHLYRLDDAIMGVGALVGGFFMSKFMYSTCKTAQEYRDWMGKAVSGDTGAESTYLRALRTKEGLLFAMREHSGQNTPHELAAVRLPEWVRAARLPEETTTFSMPASNLVSTTTDPMVLNGIGGHESFPELNFVFIMPDEIDGGFKLQGGVEKEVLITGGSTLSRNAYSQLRVVPRDAPSSAAVLVRDIPGVNLVRSIEEAYQYAKTNRQATIRYFKEHPYEKQYGDATLRSLEELKHKFGYDDVVCSPPQDGMVL